MSVFGPYSRYYDILYRDKDYAAETRFVARCLEEAGIGGKDILELGCGAGMHASLLAQSGFRVHGVDRSEGMLEMAQTRRAALADDIKRRLEFERADIRVFRRAERFDGVISLFHVMSYQTTSADLHAAFATAADHLGAGGVFAFDFWYGPAVVALRPESRVRRCEGEGLRITRYAEPSLVESDNRVDVEYTLLVEHTRTGRREEIRETHPMRYLFMAEIDSLLVSVGLRRVKAVEWLSDEPLSDTTWNGFVAARKDD